MYITLTMPYIVLIIVFLFSYNNKTKEKTNTQHSPNIVWIMLEDWGYQLSCYGEAGIITENIDDLANSGIRYINSFCTSPVCSPSRSAMMTGFHQNYIGANQHRTAKKFGFPKKALPDSIKPITQFV